MTTEITLAGRPITKPDKHTGVLTLLVWGLAGSGKTTLAATAPGRKLFLSFDLAGTASISDIPDVGVADLSDGGEKIAELFRNNGNPLGLKGILPHYDTIIIDSLTGAINAALMYGINADRGSSIEHPAPRAYQTRNALVLNVVRNVVRLCLPLGKHVIFTAHENGGERNTDGNLIAHTIMLGGQMIAQVPPDISEVWHLSVDDTGARHIRVRSTSQRYPMKTRMWNLPNGHTGAFQWRNGTRGQGLDEWIKQWKEAGAKIPVPK